MRISTDYLVVGAGATALAFADTLISHSDADIVLVDKRDGVGGHWRDAYPFLRLHSPSAYYGVDSLQLGDDRIDESGPNVGLYERATADEVRDYFERLVTERLAPTGRIRVLTSHEYLGRDGASTAQLRDGRTGGLVEVEVRRRVVDARYLEASVPATHVRPFESSPQARVEAVNALDDLAGRSSRFTIMGAGKTAVDACLWLLDAGVDPERIRWIRPRDGWFTDRRSMQPLEQVASILEGIATDAVAAAGCSSVADLFETLEDHGRMLRIDRTAPTTMYRGTMLTTDEIDQVRQIADVVRLGRVRRIETDRVLLERGEIPTAVDVLHVDCTARGLRIRPPVPIFTPGQMVLQQVRHLSPTFNAALIAYVEVHRDNDRDRNLLCTPNPYPSSVNDWPAMMRRTWRTEIGWAAEPDLAAWVAGTRLNLLGALPSHLHEARARDAATRYARNIGAALGRLDELDRPVSSGCLG